MTIDQHSVQLIKHSAGAIKEQAHAINRLVYEHLRRDHPAAYGLLQQAGLPPLASIVANYAAGIDNLEVFLGHAPKIALTHQRIDLQEAQFENVASALFLAFRQALDPDVLSDDALLAWRRAYDHLANILIRLQQALPGTTPPPLSQ